MNVSVAANKGRDDQTDNNLDRDGNTSGDAASRPRPRAIDPDEPAARVIRTAIVNGLGRMRASTERARRGEVDGIHRLRTSTRRLRSTFRSFKGLVETGWADGFEAELKWLAGLLGAVRDLDVLRERLRLAAGEWVEDLGPLFTALAERHARASEASSAALQGERHERLIAVLDEAAGRPALRDEANAPCRSALPPLIAATWSKLKKRGRALAPTDPDEDFHEVRKRAKRARYTAEAVAPALGPDLAGDAERFVRLATTVQDVLGEHQDAVGACREVLRLVAERPQDGRFNLAAGRLLERQEHAASAARSRFFEVWAKLDRKKVTRWLRG